MMITTIFTVFGMFATSAVWMSRQFSLIRNLVYDKHEQLQKFITDKIEYHERHDDDRFNAVTKDLWELRVRNALVDGRLERDRIGTAKENEITRNLAGTIG